MLKRIVKKIFCVICVLWPHKKTIIFESGDNVFDNGFVLANYIAKHPKYKKYKLFCVGKRKEIDRYFFPKEIRYLCFDDGFKFKLRFLKVSLRAKYIFYSYDNYWKYVSLRKSTKIIFVRHGAFPIKNVKEYYDSMFDNKNHYYVLCTTQFVKEQLEKKYPKPNVTYFMSGMPRCDLLKNNGANKVFDSIGINKAFRIIIIACTFRHFNDPNSSFFEDEFPISLSESDLREINNSALKHKVILVFKLHHAQLCGIKTPSYSNIIFANDKMLEKNKINNFDLFNASSALVTDYSGIFIDYLLTNKPLGFIVADKDKYSDDRGFTIHDFEKYLPGEMISSKEEFVSFVFGGFKDVHKFEKNRLYARNIFIGNYSNHSESLMDEVEKL